MPNYKYTGSSDRVIFAESDFSSNGVTGQVAVTFFGRNDVRELTEAAFNLLVASGYPLVPTTDPVGPGSPLPVPGDVATQAELDALSGTYVPKSLVDAAGDLLVGSAADTLVRLPKGNDTEVLTVTGGAVGWAAVSGGGGDHPDTDHAGFAPLADPTFTGTVTLPATAAPGTGGANSLRLGPSATAAGAGGTSVGSSAQAGGANTVAIGFDARATQASSVAIGGSSRAIVGSLATAIGYAAAAAGANGALAVGYAASAAGAKATAIGASALAPASSCVAIGNGASVNVGQTGSVVVGVDASSPAGTFASPSVAVGIRATASEGRGTAIGADAKSVGISATAVGRGAIATTSHGIAIGRGAFTPLTGTGTQIAIGWSGGDTQSDVYFESGHTHKYDDALDSVTITRVPASIPIAIHGFDAFDATAAPTSNVAGGPLVLCGGRGTGTAVGGSVRLQVAPAGGASNNTKNALVNVVEAGVVGTATALGFFNATPVVKPTGVAVTAAGIHAALVSLGLIAA